MRSFLINKNLCLYYQLKRLIGNKWAFKTVSAIEKIILIFGREEVPRSALDGTKVSKAKVHLFHKAIENDRQ